MIYIDMGMGRLGNQFCRYAYSRLLHKYNPGEDIVYSFDMLDSAHETEGDGMENSLRHFNTIGTERNGAIKRSWLQKFVWKRFMRKYPDGMDFCLKDSHERRWLSVMKALGMYKLNLGECPFPKKKPWWIGNLIVDCCCESPDYFQEIKEELSEAFTPVHPLQEHNRELMDVIQRTNSVFVGVRRGDFVDDQEISNVYNVCSKDYYLRAIAQMRERVENPTFVFFSNDIEWVKDNIRTDAECYYESGKDEVWETFRLMRACKHFIISNSTLHWWAQYLGEDKGKVVMAPSRWYRSDFRSALYLPGWTLVDAGNP